MYHNVVHPAPLPTYSVQPPPPAPSALYGQSVNWNYPATHQYPPAGHAQYPPPVAPAYTPYPPSAYEKPYYGGAPPPPATPQQPEQQQQQQQPQVVMVSGSSAEPVTNGETKSFMVDMIFACFVMWFCNGIFGLIAYILAGK